MKTQFILSCLLILFGSLSAQVNQVPVISNLTATVSTLGQIEIAYDVFDAENDQIEIIVQVSNDAGYSYLYTSALPNPTGDIGFPITQGSGKRISFGASNATGQAIKVRITALDRKPLDIPSLVAQIDSNNLKSRLTFVEGIRHRTAGLTHLTDVADSIRNLYSMLGLGVKEGNFAFGAYTARNIIGNSTGYAQSGQTVIVDAHYDSVANAPGADDNGSGVVGMMELAQVLAQYPSQKGLRFIAFDLEETGLTGSTNYVNNLAPTDTIAGVFNFEMIGYYDTTANSQTLPTGFNILFPAAYNAVQQGGNRGNFITNVGNTASQSLIDMFRTAAQTYVPQLRVIDVAAPGVGSLTPDLTRSDHAPFWTTNRKALMITDGANFRNPNYHTANDKSSTLHFGFMQHVSQATLAAAIELAGVQHGSSASALAATITQSTEPIAEVCPFFAYRNGDFAIIKIGACNWSEKKGEVQIFNSEGRMIIQQPIMLRSQSEIMVPNIGPAGQQILFARLVGLGGEAIWSGKF